MLCVVIETKRGHNNMKSKNKNPPLASTDKQNIDKLKVVK